MRNGKISKMGSNYKSILIKKSQFLPEQNISTLLIGHDKKQDINFLRIQSIIKPQWRSRV